MFYSVMHSGIQSRKLRPPVVKQPRCCYILVLSVSVGIVVLVRAAAASNERLQQFVIQRGHCQGLGLLHLLQLHTWSWLQLLGINV